MPFDLERAQACSKLDLSSVRFSPLTDWVVKGWRWTGETIQQRSSSNLLCRRPLRAVLAPWRVGDAVVGRRNAGWPHQRVVLEKLSWRVTCLNHAIFCLLTVARRGSCGPKRKLILLRTKSSILCFHKEMRRSFLRHLVSEGRTLFFRESKQSPRFTATKENGDK